MRFLPSKKSASCPICGDIFGKCRTKSDSDLILCANSDRGDEPSGYCFVQRGKNIWNIFAPSLEEHVSGGFTVRRHVPRSQPAEPEPDLPSLKARHALLSAQSRTLTEAQNADLLWRGLLQTEIDGCLSRGWLWAERGGYGIAAIDPVTDLIVGGQIAADNRAPKYKWLLAGQTHLPETGENPLAVWVSPQFDPEQPAKIRPCEGFLKSLITAIKAWRVDHQVVLVGAAGGQFGEKALARILSALPQTDDIALMPDAGAISNRQVMREYQRLQDRLRKEGRSLRVIWWQQYTKNSPDCDELDGSEAPEMLSWGEFARLATQPIQKLNQRYLPALELPSEGGTLAIDSAMGTGKTEALEGLLTQFWRQHPDGKADLIGYRNGLLTQTCERINQKGRGAITHKHEMRSLIRWDATSMAYCVNSLDSRIHHLHAAIDAGQKVLIALDEVDFVIRHALDMMRSQPGTGLEFARLIQRIGQGNGYILAMQADLQDLPLALLRELCGADFPISVIKNEYRGQPWNTEIVTPLGKNGKPSNGQAGLGAAEMAIASIGAGEFPLIVTTAQEWLETLTKAASAKILRCDRYTVAAARAASKAASQEQKILLDLFKNPRRAIAAAKKLGVQAIGLTPTAETGISIDGVEFGRIIGYFPVLTSESAIQLLGRDRHPNTPRYIFAADRAAGSKEGEGIYPEQILKNWKLNARKGFEIAKVREALSPEELQALDAEPDPLLATLSRFAAWYQARANSDKLRLHANIAARLEAAGHNVQRSTVSISEGFREQWQAAKAKISQRNHQIFAQSKETSVSEALEVLRSGVGTRKQVYSARKTLTLANYPGLDLNTPETVGRLIFERRGAALKEYTQAWLLKYPAVAAEIDRACWKAHLGQKIIWQPAIKRNAYKSQLLADSGILALLDLEEYSESSPEVEAIRAYCLKNAAALRLALGYTSAFGEAHSGIKMADWLLRRLGYAQRRVRRCGARGEQVSYWAVVDLNSRDRTAVEKALALKWAETLQDKDSEAGSSHFDNPNLLRKMGSTDLESAPIQGGGLVKWGTRLGDWIIESIAGDVAKVRQATGYASRLLWDAPLAELREVAT